MSPHCVVEMWDQYFTKNQSMEHGSDVKFQHNERFKSVRGKVDTGEKAGHIVLSLFTIASSTWWSLPGVWWNFMWQETTHPVNCRMCEVCLNWLWWRKLQTLGRTMCNTCRRTDYCGSSTLWNADCYWVLLNIDRSSFNDTTGGGWWLHWQIWSHYRISKKVTIFICFISGNTSVWILITHVLQYAWKWCLSNYIPVVRCVEGNLTVHSMIQLVNPEL